MKRRLLGLFNPLPAKSAKELKISNHENLEESL